MGGSQDYLNCRHDYFSANVACNFLLDIRKLTKDHQTQLYGVYASTALLTATMVMSRVTQGARLRW